MADVEFTIQGIERVTQPQIEAIRRFTENRHKVEVGIAFDLPEGYVCFVSTHYPSGNQVYGGISPEGEVST